MINSVSSLDSEYTVSHFKKVSGHVASHRDLCKYSMDSQGRRRIFSWPLISVSMDSHHRWSSWWESLPFQKAVFYFSQGEPWALTCLWSCVSDSASTSVWRRAIWNSQFPANISRYIIMTTWKLYVHRKCSCLQSMGDTPCIDFPPVRTDL